MLDLLYQPSGMVNNCGTPRHSQEREQSGEPLLVAEEVRTSRVPLPTCPHDPEKSLGPIHPETRNTRKNYATCLRMLGRDAEAAALETSDEPSAE